MLATQRKLFVVAGEPSGDQLGGAFLSELKKTVSFEARGVGGPDMRAAGLVSLFDMSDLSVMGIVDVVGAIPRLYLRLDRVVRAALAWQPDAVVLIDNKVFSQMVAKRLKRAGYRGAIFLYVAPSVWAWKPDRARKIAPLFDEVLAVLPFEPVIMADLGGPLTSFVGHPAENLIDPDRRKPDTGLVTLLPGSRGGELKRHLPLFGEVAERLADHPRVTGFALPTLAHLKTRLDAEVANWGVPVRVVATPEDRQSVFDETLVALVGAGTVTLELAMMDVPMVCTYVPDWFMMRAYKRWGRPLIGLPNVILGEEVLPEIRPGPDHASRVAAAMKKILDDTEAQERQSAGFAKVRDQIVNGLPDSPRTSAAARIRARLVEQE